MNRAERHAAIDQIRDRFDRMVSAVFVDFAGMSVEAVTKLRQEFRKSGVEYKVVKNTLIKHAVKGRPYAEALGPVLKGMTGVAWSYEEPAAAAKVIKTFARGNEKLKVKGGLVEADVLSPAKVEGVLASMPGRDELRGMLLATFLAPMQSFVAQLNAPVQNFAYVLDARRRQQGGEQGSDSQD
jgi:large subunit ribosomal protein L10